MIIYSWKKVYQESRGSIRRLLEIIEYLTYRPIPTNVQDQNYNYSQINWSGHSFLLNPEDLLSHKKDYKRKEIGRYIGLASLRLYSEYKVSSKLTLDIEKCPLSIAQLNVNRLLYIEDGQIHFLYEEVAKEKKYGSIQSSQR